MNMEASVNMPGACVNMHVWDVRVSNTCRNYSYEVLCIFKYLTVNSFKCYILLFSLAVSTLREIFKSTSGATQTDGEKWVESSYDDVIGERIGLLVSQETFGVVLKLFMLYLNSLM